VGKHFTGVYPWPRKNHRNKMESIIFVLKKVFGEHLSATSSAGQRQQTRFRIIAHNAYVRAKRFIMEDFYAPSLHST